MNIDYNHFHGIHPLKNKNGNIVVPLDIRSVIRKNQGNISLLTAFIFKEDNYKYIGIYDTLGLKIDILYKKRPKEVKRYYRKELNLINDKIQLPDKMKNILPENVLITGDFDHFSIWNPQDHDLHESKNLEKELISI